MAVAGGRSSGHVVSQAHVPSGGSERNLSHGVKKVCPCSDPRTARARATVAPSTTRPVALTPRRDRRRLWQEIYKKEAVNGKDSRTHLDKNEVQAKKEIREKKKLQVKNQIQHQSPMQQPSASLMCPVEKKCGACNYLSVDYDKQLKKKQQDLEQLLHPL